MPLIDKGTLRAYHLGLISCVIGFMAGYDSGVAGGILTFKSFSSDFHYNPKSSAETTVNSLTVSLEVLGAFLSCFIAPFFTERFGRRLGIRVFSSIFILGIILQSINDHSLGAWYFARIVGGFGQGGCTAIVPIFVAEMAPKELRGRLGSFYQWLFTWGIFTAYWINYGMTHDVNPNASKQWQIPISLQLIPGVILFGGTFTVKESVRWLLKNDRNDEAWQSLSWVRASTSEQVEAEFAEIQRGLRHEAEIKKGLRKTEVLVGENGKRVYIGSVIFLFQQMTGANALAYFSPQFFKLIVGGGDRDILLTALFGAVKVIACTIFILFFAKRLGRRTALISGAVAQGCCMLPLAIVLKTVPVPKNAANLPVSSAAKATVALLYLNIMAYNFSWGPVPWAYVPEIFPNRTREIGVGICVAMHWLWSFVFTFTASYMINNIGWGAFLFYAICDWVMAAWVYFSVKETRGKSLEAVQDELNHRIQSSSDSESGEGEESVVRQRTVHIDKDQQIDS